MYQAIVFLPLLGFLIVGLFGGSLGAKASEYITTGFMVVAAVLSWVAFITVGIVSGETFTVPVLRFIEAGGLQAADEHHRDHAADVDEQAFTLGEHAVPGFG